MFADFADSLVDQAYPHLAGAGERKLVLDAMCEELNTGFQRYYHESLSDEEQSILHSLAARDDPRLGEFLITTGFDEKAEAFKGMYAAELLADVSSSLMPEGGSKALSTVRLRDDATSPTPPPARPAEPIAKPTKASSPEPTREPTGEIKISMGRRARTER